MSSIIFYGAGKNAEVNFDKWVSQGLNPVCFADADVSKHHKMFGNRGIPILPLSEALSLYPDYELYLTQMNIKQIRSSLLEMGIDSNRIKFCEAANGNLEWRRGCEELNHFIRVSGFRMFTCCYLDAQRNHLTVSHNQDYSNGIKKYTDIVSETINKLRNNIPCVCDNCPVLSEGLWEKEPRITTLVLDGWFKDDVCNLKCVYCGQMERHIGEYRLVDIAKKLSAEFPDIKNWFYTGGELSIYPYKQELYDFAREKKWKLLDVFTNAVVYDNFFADDSVSDKKLNVSLDSGTRETYYKIKQKDLFERVINNLKQYSNKGCEILLKYILLENVNDSFNEFENFTRIACDLGTAVKLSFDQEMTSKILKGSKLYDSICLFIEMCRDKGLKLEVEDRLMDFENMQEFHKIARL